MSTIRFLSALLLTGVLTSTASAHVSVASGVAAADKSQKITFGLSHGCEVGGVHYDTKKVRIEIPAGVTSVRAMRSDFGTPVVTKVAGAATQVEWAKPASEPLLPEDDGFYEITIRARVANTPFTKLKFVIHQICVVNNVDVTMSWDQAEGATTGNPAPHVTVVPARLNTVGWNKFTIPAGASIPTSALGTYFADAHIVWKGTAAYSSNANTLALIATTPGVTMLDTELVAGDEIWVKY